MNSPREWDELTLWALAEKLADRIEHVERINALVEQILAKELHLPDGVIDARDKFGRR